MVCLPFSTRSKCLANRRNVLPLYFIESISGVTALMNVFVQYFLLKHFNAPVVSLCRFIVSLLRFRSLLNLAVSFFKLQLAGTYYAYFFLLLYDIQSFKLSINQHLRKLKTSSFIFLVVFYATVPSSLVLKKIEF